MEETTDPMAIRPKFMPGDTVYTLLDGLIHRVMIIKVDVTIYIDAPVHFLYRFEDSRDRTIASTEVFATKTDLVDWLMRNIQNEGAS
jgi:hypothetical protein